MYPSHVLSSFSIYGYHECNVYIHVGLDITFSSPLSSIHYTITKFRARLCIKFWRRLGLFDILGAKALYLCGNVTANSTK